VRITFLGSGTSHGVPMIGCGCATCTSSDPRDRRFRPAVRIETDAGTSILIDTPPDLRSQALACGVDRVDLILFTHSHADHVFGLDDVRRYNALQGGRIPCYGDPQTLRDLRQMFGYVFDPDIPGGGGLPQIELLLVAGEFSVDRGALIVPVPIFHGRRPILGYRVGGFAYLTDCSAIPEASWPLLEGVDTVVLGALRDRPHPTHFSLAEAVETARRLGARRTWFTHMSHDLPHAATCARLPPGVELAYDGLVVTV
jgi:phosphoribosyl 1,2-cyclic phosphate phosphodiesterase